MELQLPSVIFLRGPMKWGLTNQEMPKITVGVLEFSANSRILNILMDV